MFPNLGLQENFLEVVTPKRTGSKVEGAFQAEKTPEANSQRTGPSSMWGNYRQSSVASGKITRQEVGRSQRQCSGVSERR